MIADARNSSTQEGEEGEIPQNQVSNDDESNWEPCIEKKDNKVDRRGTGCCIF
jgi:hypothetical protein